MRYWCGHARSEYSNKGQVGIGWCTILWFILTDMIFPHIYTSDIWFMYLLCYTYMQLKQSFHLVWLHNFFCDDWNICFYNLTFFVPCRPASHITGLYYVWLLSLYIHKIGNRIIIKQSKRQLNVVLLALVYDEILTQFHIYKLLSEK